MTTITVRVRRSRRKSIKQLIRSIPGYCTGRLRDSYGVGRSFRLNYAIAFLERVSVAYDVKSRGGTDDLGNKWKPLKRSTIAQRPVGPGERKRLGIKPGERHRGLLTAGQDRLWRAIFRSTLHRLMNRGVDEAQAKVMAAKLAWAILKRQGAKTKLEVLGGRTVLINRVSDALFKSFSPGRSVARGVTMSYTPPADQVFEVEKRGMMRVGSKLKYAKHVQRLRPIIPKRRDKWDKYASGLAVDAVIRSILRVMG